MLKTALVLGCGGQTASYLCETLIEKGYRVHGLYPFFDSLRRVEHLKGKMSFVKGDILDATSLYKIIDQTVPDEIYNEADLDNIGWSKEIPLQSFNTTANTLITILEAVRLIDKRMKVFQPLSITMFGNAPPPQNEETRQDPKSIYACAKAACWHLIKYYREEYGLFIGTGIFCNHDSPRRSEDYLLQKICRSAVRMAKGEQKSLTLGNINQRIDIGYAKEYAEVSWSILQLDKPDDYVIGTGVAWAIAQMVEEAFAIAGVAGDYADLLNINPELANQGTNTPTYIADSTKAHKAFGFSPHVTIKELISLIIQEAQAQS